MKSLSDIELKTLTTLGQNVKYVRRNILGFKLVDMSKHSGVSRDVICRLEALSDGNGSMGKGRVYPSILTVIKFSNSIGVTPGEILDKPFSEDVDIQNRILKHCDSVTNIDKGVTVI